MTSGLAVTMALLLALPAGAHGVAPDAAAPAEPTEDEPESPDGDEAGEPEGEGEDAEEPEPDAEPEPDDEASEEPEPTPVPTVPDQPIPPDREPADDEALDEELLEDEAFVDDYDPLRDSPEAVEARRLITGGIILMSTGTLLAVGSLAMGLTDKCTRAAGNSCSGAARNRAAATMAVPAVAIFTAGAALLGVGLRNRKRLRASVAFGPDGAGLLLGGRF